MNYEYSAMKYPSKDGKTTITAHIYEPKDKNFRGIIQLAHGMTDHVGRYTDLADFFCSHGYVFAGNDHLGHGKSCENPDEFGYFAKKDGVSLVVRDMHTFNKYLRETYPDLPIVMMGHSMGSFLARLYLVKYPHTVAGAIIHGTSGKNSLAGIGKVLTKLVMIFRGDHYRSKLLTNMSVGGYNKRFPKDEGKNAWLTRDVARVADNPDDPYTNFIFTASGYHDLMIMLCACNDKKWYANYPKQLPTLIMSGDADPVGNYGKGPYQVYNRLLLAGCGNVELKMYKDARHELFNEFGREEIFADMLAFTEKVIG